MSDLIQKFKRRVELNELFCRGVITQEEAMESKVLHDFFCPFNMAQVLLDEIDKLIAEIAKLKPDKAMLVQALQFECGQRCDPHYNPCNAREAIHKIDESRVVFSLIPRGEL